MLRFEVLGTLEVLHDHLPCTPGAPKVRSVLALLLSRANQVVTTETLIWELWGDEPPKSAVTTVQTYIYLLRRAFDGMAQENWLDTRLSSAGYVLHVRQGQLDVESFERLAGQGRLLLEAGRAEQGVERLTQALRLWRGPVPLINVCCGPLLTAYAAHLEEQRIRSLELRIGAELELGRHQELVGELRTLVAEYPLNESLHGRLITALHASGRRGEALRAYEDLRNILNDELSVEPSPDLQRLRHEVMTGRI